MADLNKESMAIWKSLKPMIDEEIKAQTRGAVQRRKMKVTTAPSLVTNVIGVTEPYGSEMFIPFNTNLSAAHIGDVVWVEFMYGATNAFASMYASADTKDWTVGGDANIMGNATINGVLDVTTRRCSATLSSVGWYRVLDVSPLTSAMAQGALGESIRFDISRRGSSVDAETHTIVYRAVNGGKGGFTDESSKGGSLLIDKIRYTRTSTSAHIDIHYNSSGSNVVTVYFDVNVVPDVQYRFTANSLTSVADAPAGETVVTEYSFGTDGVYTNTNLTVNGTFDVVPRRCSATLSSAGWYRVMTFEPTTNFAYADVDGSVGAIIPICVTRRYYWNGAETHKVDLLLVNGAIKFSNESSTSSVLGVDKIRYTKDSSNKGYVDIHYALSQKNQVGFRFDVYSSLDPDGNSYQGQFTSASMTSVADAPSGETVLTTYKLNANTEGVTDGWHYTLQGKHIRATKTITDTLTNYTTINGFFGYYISNITTPFTMASKKYYVGMTWSIGSGFSISAGVLSQGINSFNAYALSTASGSQDVELLIVIEGEIA